MLNSRGGGSILLFKGQDPLKTLFRFTKINATLQRFWARNLDARIVYEISMLYSLCNKYPGITSSPHLIG